jgi:putative FmdB family regulatory protein
MPTYGYRCVKNGHEFEIVQSITDPPLTRCIHCGSKVNRIFYPVGIVFKGQGFYKTDSRSASSARVGGGDKDAAESTDKSSGDKTAGDKPPGDKPAKPKTEVKKAASKKETESS